MSGFDGIGPLLRAVMDPPADAGPPFTHTFQWEWVPAELSQRDLDSLYHQVVAGVRREAEVRWAEETRCRWSGPDKVARRVLRAYGVTAREIGLLPRSVFSSEYRRRQRARVKRRRR